MHTEEQARQLWCPMARHTNTEERRIGCIASRCMMWRWQPSLSVDNPMRAPGAAIQQIKREVGFCGLAGPLP